MTVMTQAERRERNATVISKVINHILNAGVTVRVNDLYDRYNNGIFSSRQYFMRNFINTVENDFRIKYETATKIGTFACTSDQELVIPKTKKQIKSEQPKRPVGRPRKNKKEILVRKVTMKLLFGKNCFDFVGNPTNMQVTDEWIECKSVPKMFTDAYNDTVSVLRKDIPGKPAQYLQVTESGQYLFKNVKTV